MLNIDDMFLESMLEESLIEEALDLSTIDLISENAISSITESELEDDEDDDDDDDVCPDCGQPYDRCTCSFDDEEDDNEVYDEETEELDENDKAIIEGCIDFLVNCDSGISSIQEGDTLLRAKVAAKAMFKQKVFGPLSTGDNASFKAYCIAAVNDCQTHLAVKSVKGQIPIIEKLIEKGIKKQKNEKIKKANEDLLKWVKSTLAKEIENRDKFLEDRVEEEKQRKANKKKK